MIADRSPEPVLAQALLDVTRELDLRDELDRLVHQHLAPLS
ncbi:hypothetical protein ACFQX6_21595 [Streptosporangium lutulentum]